MEKMFVQNSAFLPGDVHLFPLGLPSRRSSPGKLPEERSDRTVILCMCIPLIKCELLGLVKLLMKRMKVQEKGS